MTRGLPAQSSPGEPRESRAATERPACAIAMLDVIGAWDAASGPFLAVNPLCLSNVGQRTGGNVARGRMRRACERGAKNGEPCYRS